MATPPRYTGPVLREMKTQYWELMSRTRDAATTARNMLAGELSLVFPETIALVGGNAWIGDLPQKRTGPQRTRQKLIAKQWEIKRPVTSGGPRAASVATRIEQPTNAIMHHDDAGFPWDDTNDLLLIEGLAFTTFSVDLADWRQTPGMYKPNAKGLDAQYLEDRFAIDGAGKFRGDQGYDESTVDMVAAKRDSDEERRDHRARHLPFRQRAYSIRSCAPIWGKDLTLEGLIIETHWTAARLRQQGIYVSRHADGADARLYPIGAVNEGDPDHSAGTSVTVIEAWLLDEEGQPYVSLAFDGGRHGEYAFTRGGPKRDGEPESWMRDLGKMCHDERGKWYGFSRLPISYGFGLGWSTSDMDQRAMGITQPFEQSNKNIDMLLTEIIIAGQWLALPALIEKVSIADMADQSLDEKERKTPDILPLKITKVTGDITNVGGVGPHPSMFEAISLMMSENKSEQPGGDTGQAPSGFAQTIQTALESDALTTINKSAMRMASQHASYTVEASKFLGECYGEPIRVYQIADVLIEQKHPSDTEQMLTLDPGLIGSSYDVKAIAKKTPGENPAVRQQNAALVTEGFYSRAWFLEEDGYSAPEAMANEVAWEHLVESEPGQQTTMRMLEQYVSSKYVEQIQQQIAAGQANQKGLPTGYGDGTSPPPDLLQSGPQMNGGMPGLQTPNPAAASLGAVVGAGMQNGPTQNALNQGGEMPATPLNGAAR